MRTLRATALLSLAALILPAAAHADLAAIQKRGTLRVLVMLDTKRPEFFATRPDHEVLDGFARLYKLRLEVHPVSGWDALIPALLAKKGDVIAGRFTATDERRKLVAFTAEVFPTRNIIFNRKPSKPITSLDELKNEKLGVIKGTSMAEAVAAGAYDEALKSGRITAAVWGVESAVALQREDPAIQLGPFLGAPASLAYAVRRDEPDLLSALDQYIENLRHTLTWSRLVVKYFGDAAPEVLKKARTP